MDRSQNISEYQPMGRWTSAKIELLYLDIKKLVDADPGLTPKIIAEDAKLSSEWIVRDIRKPHWHVKNPIQLFRIETALCRHPRWQPRVILAEDSEESADSFVYRRWVDPFASADFRDDALLWSIRKSDTTFLERMIDDPWVTLVDTSTAKSSDYQVVSYSKEMRERYGFDKSGIRLGQNLCPVYSRFMARDYEKVATESDRPHCKDVVYANEAMGYRVVFRNISLACQTLGLVVSKLKIEHWQAGRFEFNAPRSAITRKFPLQMSEANQVHAGNVSPRVAQES